MTIEQQLYNILQKQSHLPILLIGLGCNKYTPKNIPNTLDRHYYKKTSKYHDFFELSINSLKTHTGYTYIFKDIDMYENLPDFLKILEDRSETNHIILTALSSDTVLPTILSRCICIDCGTNAKIANRIKQHLSAQKPSWNTLQKYSKKTEIPEWYLVWVICMFLEKQKDTPPEFHQLFKIYKKTLQKLKKSKDLQTTAHLFAQLLQLRGIL